MNRVAADAWLFRALVERTATTRFAGLAQRLRAAGDADFATLAQNASEDERRHVTLCLELVDRLGANRPDDDTGWDAPPLAPRGFDARQALIYEVVAQCCVAETESMATLSTLMAQMEPSPFRDVVHAIARDEVGHARLGWAFLERHSRSGALKFLKGHLVSMLRTGGDPLWQAPCASDEDDPALVAFGVLPHRAKRAVFVEAVTEVIVPGFSSVGIDTREVIDWLSEGSRVR